MRPMISPLQQKAATARATAAAARAMAAAARATAAAARAHRPARRGAARSGKTNNGATASALGALNAGHASATAMANALAKQSTSRVGLVAAYGQQNMVADQLAAAAETAAATATA